MELEKYDFLIVGAGIFGATVAERLASEGKKVLVIDRRDHIAGNIFSYTDSATGIEIHKYGSHIFHTENEEVWNYITRFTEFNGYVHTVPTRHNGEFFPMPVNLDTINKLYEKDMTAEEAEAFVNAEAEKAVAEICAHKGIEIADFNPDNFSEQGRSLVGDKLYEAFLKNYTEKQWNTNAENISADILKRIPVRFSKDNRYFMNAKYQGIPKDGYTKIVEKMLANDNIDIKLETDFNSLKYDIPAHITVVYCGQIDQLLDYEFGVLPYRSLRFESEMIDENDDSEISKDSKYGYAVINEADAEVAYTRTHFYKYYQIHQPEVINQSMSFICREYPNDYTKGEEAYYPVNNPQSQELYQRYVDRLKEIHPNIILGGRLGAYQYWDMDVAVGYALKLASQLLS
ncbi:MAG: UDP-galactopyranose mutase [Candidatus Saccharibacteria bacterium]|nr:UDP-galactopyranose mutase [Candidatus Saccharibacteria bacterium]